MIAKGISKFGFLAALTLGIEAAGTGLRAEATRIWAFRAGSEIESSPAVAADGSVCVGTEGGYMFSILPDGRYKWFFNGALGAIKSTPASGSDGTVYFGSDDGSLYAVNGSTGAEKWHFATNDYIYSSPALGSDGTIYVGSGDGSLYAVTPDGRKLWSFATAGNIDSSPAIGPDGTIYIGSYDQRLYAIHPDGTLKWSFPTSDRIVAPPAIAADGTIYIGSKDGRLYALTPGGNSKWTVSTGGAVETSPAIGPTGTIYFASLDGFLYAVRPDGTLLWQIMPASTATGIVSSPAVRSDGVIVIGAGKDLVAAVNPEGSLRWVFPTGDAVDSSPVIATDGTIYVGSWDGNLYSISGNGSGPANSAWPLFHHDLARAGRATGSNGPTANPGRLVNLSVLDPLSASNPMLTVGLVSGGAGTIGSQAVLVRGIGPSLGAFLSGPLVANPTLTVFQGQNVVASNDNWASTAANQQAVAAADALVFAFPLSDPSSLDAALVMNLPLSPGYTVQVNGSNSGDALAEVYDATPAGAYTPASPRLINLSCLATLPTDGILTAGFIIGGSTSETVMIRATGPALAGLNLGITDVLPDPRLTLHTSVSGEDSVVALNQGWTANPQLISSIVYDSQAVGAFPLSSDNQDSVLLVTLAPGAYTAQVQSISGAGGNALIEVYEIP